MTNLCNLISRGEVPEMVRPLFFGASLCAPSKKDGGIRPIAVGNCLRRLATKVVMRPITPEIRDTVQPTQLGVGTPAGCEAAARAVRHYMESATGRKVILKIDLTNAFNTIRRDIILSAIREQFPDGYHLFFQTYSGSTNLYHGVKIIPSATGLQQGDPAGPALFSLGINSLVKSIEAELNTWFLDDGTIGDDVDSVLRAFDHLIEGFPELDEEINGGKCEIFMLNHTEEEAAQTEILFRQRFPTIKIMTPEHQDLLGSPLADEAVPRCLEEKHAELQRLTSRLVLIDSHPALILLKNCFALPKLMYILRSASAYKFPEHLARFDETVRAGLSAICNVDLTDEAWAQARLPVKHGGLGIRASEDLAASAFLASHHATAGLVDRILQLCHLDRHPDPREALVIWQAKTNNAPTPVDPMKQKSWDEVLCTTAVTVLLANANQVTRARLLTARDEGSGAWLHALPTPSLGTLLDNECLRIAVALRVGAAICQPHKCRCGVNIDHLGLHPLSCRFSAGRLPRHAGLNDIIKRALNTAGIPSVLEPPGLDRGDGRRPDGMSVVPYKNDKALVWDATCADTFAVSNVNHCALNPAHAANAAEIAKANKYRNLEDRFIFQPIAVETTGVFGPSTKSFLKELGRLMTVETGDPREGAWLRQRLCLAIARGNALCITASAKEMVHLLYICFVLLWPCFVDVLLLCILHLQSVT